MISIFERPAWYKASLLSERVLDLTIEPSALADCDWALAERRIARWRSRPPLSVRTRYQERLRAGNLDHRRLLFILGESAEHLQKRMSGRPAWLAQMEVHYKQLTTSTELMELPAILAKTLVLEAARQLRSAAEREFAEWHSAPCTASFVTAHLLACLVSRLKQLELRTLTLEFNACRLRESLREENDKDAWEAFLARIETPSVSLAVFEEYPCLARLIVEITGEWIVFGKQFIRHLREDWSHLSSLFGSSPDQLEFLLRMPLGLGAYESIQMRLPGGVGVEYIPHSLASESRFDTFLHSLNESAGRKLFACRRILARDGHGWGESILGEPPETDAERRLRSASFGRWFALLHVFETVLIDAESFVPVRDQFILSGSPPIFGPRLLSPTSRGVVQDILDNSVLRLGLARSFAARCKSMELDWDECCAGFGDVYRLLAGDLGRERTQAYLSACGGDEFRIAVRPAAIYSLHLRNLTHPDMLRDALDRERYLNALWAAMDSTPLMAALAPYEASELDRCKTPIFMVRPGFSGIWTSREKHILFPNQSTAVERVRHRLTQLSESDRERQLWILRASQDATLSTAQITNRHVSSNEPATSRDRLVHQAAVICLRLNQTVIKEGRRVSWLGLVPTKGPFVVEPSGYGLADGLPGIALFLAYFGVLTGSDKWRPLAEAAFGTAMEQFSEAKSNKRNLLIPGVMDGVGGLLYVLPHLAKLWGQPSLITEAKDIMLLLDGGFGTESGASFGNGMSGLICSLVGFYGYTSDKRALELANRLGWYLRKAHVNPDQGFSEGAAGVSLAFLRLALLTNDELFRDAAVETLLKDRERLLSGQHDWSGLERADPGWCDAAGAGLVRLDFQRALEDPNLTSDVESIFDRVARTPFGSNHSLCSGDLGRMEFLCSAARVLGSYEREFRANSLAADVLADIEIRGPRSDTAGGVATPGLARGLAGIGYGLLHLAFPGMLPSVLLLEPPQTKSIMASIAGQA